MKILITGAGGFVGAACVDAALAAGHNPLAIVRPDGNTARLKGKKINVLALDLTDPCALNQAMAEHCPEVIVHAAWHGLASAARHNTAQITDNLAMGLALVEAATTNGVRKFIGIGSQSEYGPMFGKVAETALPMPTSIYGAAKVALQVLSAQLCAQAGLQFAWLRLFSAYGPQDNLNWLIPSLITQMMDGRRPQTTEGRQLCDYLYIEDVANAIMSVAETPEATGIFNLGSGQPVRVRWIVETIRDLISPKLDVVFGDIPYRHDQIWHMEADIERLKALTGFSPKIGMTEGLSRTIEWHKKAEAGCLQSEI